MIQITEKDDRLFVQFWDNTPMFENGFVKINTNPALVQEIDISAHIERAVARVLDRRS